MTKISVSYDGDRALILITGCFDYGMHGYFEDVSEQILGKGEVREIVVDLRNVRHFDYWGMELLLELRKRAHLSRIAISLCCGEGIIRKILEIADFPNLFRILPAERRPDFAMVPLVAGHELHAND